MIFKTLTTWLILIAFTMQGSFAIAQEQDEQENTPPKVEMLIMKVLVLDPDDHPVEGATVKPRGLRTRVNSGSWWRWNDRRDGPVPEGLTDEHGIAEVPYPKYMQEKMEVGKLNLNVTHPDFVLFDGDRSVDDATAKVTLKRGFRIAVTAIDADTGDSIQTDLHAIVSVQAGGEWKLKKGGMLVSSTLEKQDCILRLAQFEEGKPTKFSSRIDIKPGDRSRVLLKDVKLALGTRVEGKLGESVPRPVKQGQVAASMNRNANPDARGWNVWSWSDKAKIAEDGTFVFESLPRDEVLQLIAVCDGWAASKTKKSDVLKHFPKEVRWLNINRVLPQLIKTDSDTVDIVLPMTQTKSVQVTALDPDGNPLSETGIWSCPNQYWFEGGSQIVGAAYSSRDLKTDPEKSKSEVQEMASRFAIVTDEKGEATMNNLPDTGFPFTLSAQHNDFELPNLFGDREVIVRYKTKGDASARLKMQKKGTDVVDGKQKEAAQNARVQIQKTTNEIKNALEGWLK